MRGGAIISLRGFSFDQDFPNVVLTFELSESR